MWRRLYLVLVAVRLYCALAPSYIHPDEHFQGPEVIAGDIFGWQTTKTWEFTSPQPIRSVFPLWAAYGVPMQLLHWITADAALNPSLVYTMLRVLFFLVSFVLEDWALQELVSSPRVRRTALILLASSYVTWTYQTHTFSNSVETIAVCWSLVLIQRISASKESALISSALLGCTAVFGIFNRITFPAFIIIPAIKLIPHYVNHPLAFIVIITFSILTALLGIYMDTTFYSSSSPPTSDLSLFSLSNKVITPLNNLLYNSSPTNLAAHGIHPRYTHLLINIPQLLGPATLSMLFSARLTLPLLSALSGIAILSYFPHQEARFLIPCVPLILSSIHLPKIPGVKAVWILLWIAFNAALGVLMGVFHQGGVVPMQLHIRDTFPNATRVGWWKTYSPPTWLLGEMAGTCETVDLMGSNATVVVEWLAASYGACSSAGEGAGRETYFVKPASREVEGAHDAERGFRLERVWVYKRHLGLDDLDVDFSRDGVWGSVRRVVDGRGLELWRVVDVREAHCGGDEVGEEEEGEMGEKVHLHW
ncbi:Alg9-like mannosyltransferase family-domain-containing protein [Peziza echinospora]|nr:Alg9-like mannosyltransferase family-domain-containing protein [Peziza echinospora]